MDDTILIIIFAVAIAIIVYIILDLKSEEEEIIENRLNKIALGDSQDERPGKKKANIFDTMINFYLEPFINHLKKKKQEGAQVGKKGELRVILMQSGRPYGDDDVLKYTAMQALSCVIFVVLSLIIGFILLKNNLLLMFAFVAMFGVVGYIFPIIYLRRNIKKRYKEISYNLPDTLDLLVVCVEAGLGLDAALTRVSQEQVRTAPILARELGRVSKDILAGIPRQEAFRNLAIRNNIDDLKSLVALLVQTDKLGTSIADSLRVYADTVRTKRRQKAEKLAAEASVKMVIPLVLFILPSMFVVLLGPAILNLVEQFAGGI